MSKTKQRHCRCCNATLVGKKQHWTRMCSSCIRKRKIQFEAVGVTGALGAYILYKKVIANRTGESI